MRFRTTCPDKNCCSYEYLGIRSSFRLFTIKPLAANASGEADSDSVRGAAYPVLDGRFPTAGMTGHRAQHSSPR